MNQEAAIPKPKVPTLKFSKLFLLGLLRKINSKIAWVHIKGRRKIDEELTIPGLFEWMANMAENTLLSWALVAYKREKAILLPIQ